ncbi:MAG: hypothetical protein U0S36_13090 [Candidatus Nanopelagicales bacterium]
MSSTVREDGVPSASAVESTIALGSARPASPADSTSSNHAVNWASGVLARSPSRRRPWS